jgi:hypothetical protein
MSLVMARHTSALATQANALRTLADELEAGKRKLSPAMAKALTLELTRADEREGEEPTKEDWEGAWAEEISRRLADYDAGKARKVDLAAVLESLRDSLR